MIKVSALYPNQEGKHFDMEYYLTKHIPMVREKLGAACTAVEIDQGLAGLTPGTPPAFVALAHLYFDSVEIFQEAFARCAAEILADIPNYTDLEPALQISGIKMK